VRTLLGAIMMAIGVLVAGTSGLCGGIMLLVFFSSPGEFSFSDTWQFAAMVGIPFVIGCGLTFAGYRVQQVDRRD